MKRSVKARPTSLGASGRRLCGPRSQTLRSPFLSSTVVSVAVEICASVAASVGSSVIIGILVCGKVRPSRG